MCVSIDNAQIVLSFFCRLAETKVAVSLCYSKHDSAATEPHQGPIFHVLEAHRLW